jgi:hypothetical protein
VTRLRLRLARHPSDGPFADFDAIVATRQEEADRFHFSTCFDLQAVTMPESRRMSLVSSPPSRALALERDAARATGCYEGDKEVSLHIRYEELSRRAVRFHVAPAYFSSVIRAEMAL